MRPKPEHSAYQLSLFSSTDNPASPTEVTSYNLAIYRVALVREASLPIPRQRLHSSQDAAAVFRAHLQSVDREHFVILLLDRKNTPVGLHTVSIGSLTASVVAPREVFKAAILANAAAIICGHNHPSGDPQPSQEDRVLTSRLVQGGKLLGIEILDHIILGDGTDTYFSFADNGTLA